MSEGEFDFLAAFMGEKNLKTSIECFVADAKKASQPTAIALPLLKLVSTLLIVLVAMPKEDGRILLTIFYGALDDTNGKNGFNADICAPEQLTLNRIVALLKKSQRDLQEHDSPDSKTSPQVIILRYALQLILQQLEN